MEYSLSLAASSSLQLQSSKASLSRGQSGCQTSQLTLTAPGNWPTVLAHTVSVSLSGEQWLVTCGSSNSSIGLFMYLFGTLVLCLHTSNFRTRPPYSPNHLLLYCWGGCWLLRQTSWLWPAVKSKVALPVVLRPWALYTLTSGVQTSQKNILYTYNVCAAPSLSAGKWTFLRTPMRKS